MPGDILYVREAWGGLPIPDFDNPALYYAAEANTVLQGLSIRWQPSMFMPQPYARNFLRVADLKAERVQSISAHDCRLEGIKLSEVQLADISQQEKDWIDPDLIANYCDKLLISNYESLWDKLNGKRSYEKSGCAKRSFAWRNNPGVWAYTFEKLNYVDEGMSNSSEYRR